MKIVKAKKPGRISNKLGPLLETLGDSVIPRKYRRNLEHYLERASIKHIPYKSFGLGVVLTGIASFILALVGLATFSVFSNFNVLILILTLVVAVPVLFTILLAALILFFGIYLEVKIYYKIKNMEEVFPEFLSELALNLKSGQSLEDAIENSVEDEFGYLSDEIKNISKKISLGLDVSTAVREFTSSYDSALIEETFELIITSWQKGAPTAQLVDRIYENMRVTRFLRNKVVASVTNYRIFLSVVTVIIAPAMFAMSYYMIDLMRKITSKIALTNTSVIFPVTVNAVRIDADHFKIFSILTLIIISACTAMIISIIKTGSVKEGYKEMILFAAGSYLSYIFALFIFRFFFGFFTV